MSTFVFDEFKLLAQLDKRRSGEENCSEVQLYKRQLFRRWLFVDDSDSPADYTSISHT